MKKYMLFLILFLFFPLSFLNSQSLDDQLFEAVKANDFEKVKILVEQGVNVNVVDKDGGTVLMWATYKSDLRMVKYLIERGADYKRNIVYPFYITGEWYFSSLLSIAVQKNNMEMLKYFIDSCKIDINESGIDAKFNNTGKTKYTALHCAVNNSLKDFVIYLLDNGADFNLHDLKENLTPLDLAIKSQNFKIAKIFRYYGQESSYYYDNLKEENQEKFNYLSVENIDVFELIELGLDSLLIKEIRKNNSLVYLKNKVGETLLHKAVYFGNIDLLNFILKSGALIDEQDNNGNTPLLKAILCSNLEISKILVEKGSNLNISNNRELTPYILSKSRNYYELMELLKKKGVDVNEKTKYTPELKLQIGHSSEIGTIACSKDGKYIASNDGGKIILWEAQTGKILNEIFDEKITCVEFSPDSKIIAYSCNEFYKKEIKLIDIYTFEIIKVFYNDEGSISRFTFSNDGKYLAGYDISRIGDPSQKSIKIWDILKCKLIKVIKEQNSSYVSIVFAHKGDFFVTGKNDGNIEIWNINSFEKVKSMVGHSNAIISFCLSKDDKTLLSRGFDSTLKKWDLNIFKELNSIILLPNIDYSYHEPAINSLFFSDDDKSIITFLSSYESKNIVFFNINTLEIEKNINVLNLSEKELSDYVINNNKLIFAFNKRNTYVKNINNIKIYDYELEKEINNIEVYVNHILWNSFSPLGNYLILLKSPNELQIQNVITGNCFDLNGPKNSYIFNFQFSSDEKYLLCVFADNQTLKYVKTTTILLYEITNKKIISSYNISGLSFGANFSFDNKYFICACNKEIKIWNTENGNENKTISIDNNSYLACFSPDKKNIAVKIFQNGRGEDTQIFDLENGELIKTYKKTLSDISFWLSYSPNGDFLLDRNPDAHSKIVRVNDGKNIEYYDFDNPLFYSFSSDNKYLILKEKSSLKLQVINFINPKEIYNNDFTGSSNYDILSSNFINEDKFIATIFRGGEIRVWDFKNQKDLFSFFALGQGNWVVVSPEGKFDASPNGMKLMHFVVNTEKGPEAIDLEQFKERYYEPGLLSKLLGYNSEPMRDVKGFNDVQLFPDITLSSPNENNGKLGINLKNRGGGIGKVRVLINQKEIFSEYPGPDEVLDSPELNLSVPIKGNKYLFPGEENEIEVFAFNKEEYLSSRGIKLKYLPEGTVSNDKPEFYAIIVGISDYEGTALDLRYASKDAEDIAGAIKIGASSLFGSDKTHIRLFSTSIIDINNIPTKENIKKAFDEFSLARPQDVFLVFLSGHGVNLGSGTEKEDFYYLTKEARTGNLEDPVIKEQTSISSKELTELMLKISALKQILILDVCGSGEVVKKLTDKRDIPSSQIRAFERMKDRTGLNILTGCAADAVSYEASRFAQGLLTYTLLMGIKGAALKDDGMIDVRKLFEFSADKVPELAKDVGGIQQPRIFGGASFDIGQIKGDDKTKIPLSTQKPLVLKVMFIDQNELTDKLEINNKINDVLRDISTKGKDAKVVFIDVDEFPDAYKLSGLYVTEGSNIKVTIKVSNGKVEMKRFEIMGSINDINGLVKNIIIEAEKIIAP